MKGLGKNIWDNNGVNAPFNGQVKYVLVIDHNNPASPCGQNYCGLRDGETVPVSLEQYFANEDVLLHNQNRYTLIRRFKDMVGPNRRNSGNVIVILDAEGLSPQSELILTWQFGDRLGLPEWVPNDIALKLEKGSRTVHGSISAYESNTLFTLFYPYGNGDLDNQSRINDFLDVYTPRETLDGETIDRLTTNHADVFVNAVSNSHLLLMENGGQ